MESEKIKNDKANTIGQNIRRMRIEQGLGQTELVRKLQLIDVEMTRESLVKIERGIQHVQVEQLRGIKNIFNTTYEKLLEN